MTFDLLPWKWMCLGVTAALGVSMAANGVLALQVAQARTDAAEHKAAASETARLASLGYRAKEQQRVNDINTAVEAAHAGALVAQADAVRAAVAAVGLRDRAKAAISRATPSDPAAAAICAPVTAAALVQSDVLDWLEARGREAAAALDTSHREGVTCEAAYEANRK